MAWNILVAEKLLLHFFLLFVISCHSLSLYVCRVIFNQFKFTGISRQVQNVYYNFFPLFIVLFPKCLLHPVSRKQSIFRPIFIWGNRLNVTAVCYYCRFDSQAANIYIRYLFLWFFSCFNARNPPLKGI